MSQFTVVVEETNYTTQVTGVDYNPLILDDTNLGLIIEAKLNVLNITGDMQKSIYDANNSGVVDNAELVNGLSVETAVPENAVFTDTIYDDTSVVKTTDIGTVTSAMLADTYLTTHQDISGKLDKNTPITAGTATKITYDANGLVTGGASLTAGDIPDLSGTYLTSETSHADVLVDSDIGVTVQAYDVNTVIDSSYVHTDNNFTITEKSKLGSIEDNANNYVLPSTVLDDADIGSTVQAYDADTTKNDISNTFTSSQIGTVTIEDSAIDLSVSNNFTINTGGALSFTGLTNGQSGNIIINNVAITSISASIYAPSGLATTLSTAGYYVIGYYVANGVVYITSSTALTAGGA